MIHQNKYMEQSILNLFEINLESIPDKFFIEDPAEVDMNGNIITISSKKIQDKNFHLFEIIEAKDYGGKFSKIVLKSMRLHKVNVYALRKLINTLFKILGPDHNNKGRWCLRDFRQLYDKENDVLFGRSWQIETLKISCALDIDREENSITLTIHRAALLKINST